MGFTDNQNLEVQTEGQADWDTGLNADFQIIDRGWHITLIANEPINTGDILWASSGAYANVYNANSLDLRDAIAISYKAVSSGESDLFLARGQINSMDIWSGNIIPGLPVFPDVVTPGFAVNCFSAAWPPIGLAMDNNAVYFDPGHFSFMPEIITDVVSLAIITGSAHDFTMDLGHRGIGFEVKVTTNSFDAHKLRFWSGSGKVSSEALYDTLTTSVDGGAADFDISSILFRDISPWRTINTDVASPGLIYGRIDAQSASSVGSDSISIEVSVERFR